MLVTLKDDFMYNVKAKYFFYYLLFILISLLGDTKITHNKVLCTVRLWKWKLKCFIITICCLPLCVYFSIKSKPVELYFQKKSLFFQSPIPDKRCEFSATAVTLRNPANEILPPAMWNPRVTPGMSKRRTSERKRRKTRIKYNFSRFFSNLDFHSCVRKSRLTIWPESALLFVQFLSEPAPNTDDFSSRTQKTSALTYLGHSRVPYCN